MSLLVLSLERLDQLAQAFVYNPANQKATDSDERWNQFRSLCGFNRFLFSPAAGLKPSAPVRTFSAPVPALKYSTASRFPIPASEESDFFPHHAKRWAALISQGFRFSEAQTAKTGEAGLRMTCSHCGTWLELVDDAQRQTDPECRYRFHKEILKACDAFAERHTGTNAHSTQPRA